jgi:uncharacterized protein (TIGR02246 family)
MTNAMIRLSLALVVAACLRPAFAADQEQAVVATLTAYEEAWSRHDAATVASFYYEPAMRVGKGGPVVRATRAEQQAFFDGFLRGLIERGYARSAWDTLEVRLLDERTAIASGITVRYREDGTVFERVAVSYGLWLTGEGWKIFLSTTHPADTALRFR